VDLFVKLTLVHVVKNFPLFLAAGWGGGIIEFSVQNNLLLVSVLI
jgi:hypothetical protein